MSTNRQVGIEACFIGFLLSTISLWPQQSSPSRCLFGWPGIVPTAICGDDRVSLFRTPTAPIIHANFMVGCEDRIDRCPSGLDCVLTCKKRSVSGHGIAQQ